MPGLHIGAARARADISDTALRHRDPQENAPVQTLPPPLDRLRLPAIVAPKFLTSTPDLVVAACRSGLLGAFPRSTTGPATASRPG